MGCSFPLCPGSAMCNKTNSFVTLPASDIFLRRDMENVLLPSGVVSWCSSISPESKTAWVTWMEENKAVAVLLSSFAGQKTEIKTSLTLTSNAFVKFTLQSVQKEGRPPARGKSYTSLAETVLLPRSKIECGRGGGICLGIRKTSLRHYLNLVSLKSQWAHTLIAGVSLKVCSLDCRSWQNCAQYTNDVICFQIYFKNCFWKLNKNKDNKLFWTLMMIVVLFSVLTLQEKSHMQVFFNLICTMWYDFLK